MLFRKNSKQVPRGKPRGFLFLRMMGEDYMLIGFFFVVPLGHLVGANILGWAGSHDLLCHDFVSNFCRFILPFIEVSKKR